MLILDQQCIICSLELCKYFTIEVQNRDPKEVYKVTTDPMPVWRFVGLREKHGEKESVCVETNIKKEIQEEMLGRVLSKMSKRI